MQVKGRVSSESGGHSLSDDTEDQTPRLVRLPYGKASILSYGILPRKKKKGLKM